MDNIVPLHNQKLCLLVMAALYVWRYSFLLKSKKSSIPIPSMATNPIHFHRWIKTSFKKKIIPILKSLKFL